MTLYSWQDDAIQLLSVSPQGDPVHLTGWYSTVTVTSRWPCMVDRMIQYSYCHFKVALYGWQDDTVQLLSLQGDPVRLTGWYSTVTVTSRWPCTVDRMIQYSYCHFKVTLYGWQDDTVQLLSLQGDPVRLTGWYSTVTVTSRWPCTVDRMIQYSYWLYFKWPCFTPSQPLRLYQGEIWLTGWSSTSRWSCTVDRMLYNNKLEYKKQTCKCTCFITCTYLPRPTPPPTLLSDRCTVTSS